MNIIFFTLVFLLLSKFIKINCLLKPPAVPALTEGGRPRSRGPCPPHRPLAAGSGARCSVSIGNAVTQRARGRLGEGREVARAGGTEWGSGGSIYGVAVPGLPGREEE